MSRTRPSPRAVTLDAAGTLITVTRPVGETYAALAARFGGDLDPDALLAGFREAFPAMPPLAFPGARGPELEARERAWWRTLVRRVVEPAGGVPRFDDYFDALYSHYAGPAAWRPYPEAAAVLQGLRRAGLRLAVVSNFDSRLPGILAGLGLDRLVDAVVWSSAAGAAKPDAAIFRHAADVLGVTPGETLHVGDHPVADYEGARAAGLSALLVDRAAGAGPHANRETIRDLTGIRVALAGSRPPG